MQILIGDTGVVAPTSKLVGGVRERYDADPSTYMRIFDSISEIVNQARKGMEEGNSNA